MCVWCPLWPVQRLRIERSWSDESASQSVKPSRVPSTSKELDAKRTVSSFESDRFRTRVPQSSSSLPVSSKKSQHTDGPTLPRVAPAAKARPVVLFAEGRRGLQVAVCSSEAIRLGVCVGMPLGEVQSLLPEPKQSTTRSLRRSQKRSVSTPVLKRMDTVADRFRLEQLAVHCQSYSPLVGLEESPAPESLWIDISGSEDLFGGERGLAEKIRNDLAERNVRVRVAVADSWGAAWAISHFGRSDISLVPSGQQTEWLDPLPVAALRISTEVIESLQMLNVRTVGQLLRLPRTSLPSRFGKQLLLRLDQAKGLTPEILIAQRLVEPIVVEWSFEEPIADRQTLDRVCEILLERLLKTLEARQLGLRELACHWLGTVTEPAIIRLLKPTNDARHLFELLRLQSERAVFHAGVRGVKMEATEIGVPTVRQKTLFADDERAEHSQMLAELVDRLSIRLGLQAVLRARPVPDPQPEFACESIPWLDERISHEDGVIAAVSRLRCRPLRILQSPERLVVQPNSTEKLPSRVNQLAVIRVSGPERIETGWWRGPDVSRDYFHLHLANGTVLWVFLDRRCGSWFLHGMFD